MNWPVVGAIGGAGFHAAFNLIYLAAILLAVGVVTLGIGLFQA